MVALFLAFLTQQDITVGPGRTYATIDAAVSAARPLDVIRVFPKPGGYKQEAIRVRTSKLTIVGAGVSPVLVEGDGFDYSGAGKIPRAIFQIEPQAEAVTIRNFELTGAHNVTSNGAGIRINGANFATIDHCDIHGNDMGIMSSAFDDHSEGVMQSITFSHIHHNGSTKDPGYNHNLYLGGHSASLIGCEVDHSTTGHNLKSRACYTKAEDCYFHNAANREVDLVEGKISDEVPVAGEFYNCVIAKDANCTGNRGVIHFGPEKGRWPGRLRLVCCTVITYFASPVILLTDKSPQVELEDSIFLNTVDHSPTLVQGQPSASVIGGHRNWLSQGYDLKGTQIEASAGLKGQSLADDLGISPPRFAPRGLPDPPAGLVVDRGPIQSGTYAVSHYGALWSPLKLDP